VVVCGGGDPFGLIGNAVVAVNEVEPGVGWEVIEEGVGWRLSDVNLVPAHVWDFEFVWELEALDGAGDNVEAFVVSVFGGVREEELHTEADTEEGAICVDVIFEDVYEVMLVESGDGIAEGANAWEDDALCECELSW
jgi:hypothetical protein